MSSGKAPPRGKTGDPWAGFLDPGETILWQGRPNGNLRFKWGNIAISVFGVFFFGFAVHWTNMAAQTDDFIFPLFGLPFMVIGAYMVVGVHFFDAYKRRKTFYTLTTKRAFIATDVLFKSMKSFPITKETDLEYLPGPPATIYFARQKKRSNNGSYLVRIGFELIEDGEEVYQHFHTIQQTNP